MRLARSVIVVALLVALSVAARASGAAAQTPPPDAQRTAAARALFTEGLSFVQQHDWPQAVDRFRRVLELRESAAVRLNLGLALIQTGKLIEASEVLRNAAQDHSATDAIRHQATAAAAPLDARIGRITIRVDAQQAGDDVTFDGAPVSAATLGVAVPADPGVHEVALVHAGHPIAHESVMVPEGGGAEVTLAPELAVAATNTAVVTPPPAETGPHEPALYERWWFWAAVGGAVVLGVVIVLVAVAASSSPTPVAGNFDPAVLNVQVMP